MLHMLAPRTMALLASNVPLRYLFRVDVVVHRVASVASRTRGALHVVRGIEWLPPVSALGHEIRSPHAMCNIPLRRLRKVIVSPFREVTLFPKTAVNQRDIVFRELGNGIRRKIRNDRVRMSARIANDICHRRFSPVLVDLRVAFLAGLRAHVVSRLCRGLLLFLFFLA